MNLTFPLNLKIEIPSTFDPILAFGSVKVADDSAKTRSKSGNMDTAMPDVWPWRPQTRVFGNAAREMRKFLRGNMGGIRFREFRVLVVFHIWATKLRDDSNWTRNDKNSILQTLGHPKIFTLHSLCRSDVHVKNSTKF